MHPVIGTSKLVRRFGVNFCVFFVHYILSWLASIFTFDAQLCNFIILIYVVQLFPHWLNDLLAANVFAGIPLYSPLLFSQMFRME